METKSIYAAPCVKVLEYVPVCRILDGSNERIKDDEEELWDEI